MLIHLKNWKQIILQTVSTEIIQKIVKFWRFATGMIIAKIISIASQIIMGRTFGSEIYGQITLILLLASYFAIPMVNGWGIVFTKIAVQENDKEIIKQAIKSLLIIVFLSSALMYFTLTALSNSLSSLFDIPVEMINVSIFMALFYAWWILTKQIAQGLQNWALYTAIENIWASLILAGLLVSIYYDQLTLNNVILIFIIGYLLAGLPIYKIALESLSTSFNLNCLMDIISHGWFLLLNTLVGVATFSIDRLLINKNFGADEVGIYQAHFLATYGIISAFMTIILTYIFPAFCKNEKHTLRTGIKKLMFVLYPSTILISLFIGSIVLWMYSFPVSRPLFALLCLFNAVQFHVQLKIWLLVSKGTQTSKIALQSNCIFLLINISSLLILIQYIGIIAGGASLLLAACSSLLYLIHSDQRIPHERII